MATRTYSLLPLLLAVACLPAFSQQAPKTSPNEPAKKISPIPGFDSSIMDTAADPCADFYQFACGKFDDKYPIPNDKSNYNPGANLHDYTNELLHAILNQAAKPTPNRSSGEQKIGDYYASCMNTAAIDAEGLKPLQKELDRIQALKDKRELPSVIAHYQLIGVPAFFKLDSMQDFKDATREIAVVDQAGLGLPEKDYYLRTDEKSVKLRHEYLEHMASMFRLYGEPQQRAAADAKAVLALETALARASMGMVDRRNPYNTYHIETLTDLAGAAPILNWTSLIRDTRAPRIVDLNVTNPAYFQALNSIIEQTDIETIRSYLRMRLLDSFALQLPKAFDDEHFDFYGGKLLGIPQTPARWKRCVSATDMALGEALGKVYVEKYFAGNSKQQTLDMVKNIEDAMNKDLTTLSWMSPDTKVKAIQKLDLITNKIGYPDKWRDYSKLVISPNDALGNSIRARQFESAHQLNKINKPVDKHEWGMSPPTINAHYNDSMNDITIPAGILQSPFYDRTAPEAINYGHIGAIVGHELTHGFDDKGGQFDGNGNLKNWWTPEDKKQFDARTECIANEYSSFVAVDDLHINGKMTLGENTADNGGVRLAYMAMEAYARQHNVDLSKKMDDFTPEQQFFIGYAQNWCTNARPALTRLLIHSNPHSPNKFRVIGVVRNMPEFAQAFRCKKGAPMAPADRCRVW